MTPFEKYVKKVVGFVGQVRIEKYTELVNQCFEGNVPPKKTGDSILYHEKLKEFESQSKGLELHRGDHVEDRDGNKGIVVKIIRGTSIEDHGTVAVWQEERDSYGADNCEHYCEINWRQSLKILD